ncbi:hypothetical protein AOLI_G00142190 [Acnodon oligacanthus]
MARFSCRPLSTCVLDLFSRSSTQEYPPPAGQGSSLHAAISQREHILEERKCRQCGDQSRAVQFLCFVRRWRALASFHFASSCWDLYSFTNDLRQRSCMSELKELPSEHGLTPGPSAYSLRCSFSISWEDLCIPN